MVEPIDDNSKRPGTPGNPGNPGSPGSNPSSKPDKSKPGNGGGGGASAPEESREFVLVKNDQRFVFRCARGDEAQLLAQIATLVRDPANGLSWFDAATLSQQITQSLGGLLHKPS